jgi:FHS family L-fucose permease-like MFS transporter
MDLFNHNIKRFALAGLFFLFFLWGALTCLNTILIPHLEKLFIFKNLPAFGFSNAFFGSYFIIAIPSAFLIQAVNYKRGIILGLLISALGTILFIFASNYVSYTLFIAGFVILASGITIIQVAANTFVAILGEEKYAADRLSLAQAVNSLGYVLVLTLTFNPIFARYDSIVYNARIIQQPYLIITFLILLVALLYIGLSFPRQEVTPVSRPIPSIKQNPGLYMGSVAIFFYVGAELTISRIIQINESGLVSAGVITVLLLLYWGGMMIGRFAGSRLFRYLASPAFLQINSSLTIILLIAAYFSPSDMMVWFLVPSGLFNATLFPVLFSTSLHTVTKPTCFEGAVLIMGISGGALIPALHESIAKHYGFRYSLLLLTLCYLIISGTGYYLVKNKTRHKSAMVDALPQNE